MPIESAYLFPQRFQARVDFACAPALANVKIEIFIAGLTNLHPQPAAQANRDRLDNVIGASGNDDSERDLPVIGSGGSIKGAAAVIESDFPSKFGAEIRCDGLSL